MKQPFLPMALLVVTACAGPTDDDGLATSTTRSGDTTIVTTRVRDSVPTLTLTPELSIGSDDIERPDGFSQLFTVTVGPSGEMAVYDDGRRAVLVFDSVGLFLRQVGRQGEGPGEYQRIYEENLAFLADGGLATWETMTSRLMTFHPDGRHRATWFVTDRFGGITTVHADTAGHVVLRAQLERIGETVFGREGVITFTPDGREIGRALLPVYGSDEWLVGGKIGEIRDRLPFGRRSEVTFFPDGRTVGGNSSNFRLTVAGGPTVRVMEVITPAVPVVEAERRYWDAEMTRYFRQMDPEWEWGSTQIPATKGFFTRLIPGGDGSLLVRVAQPGIEIPNPWLDRPLRAGAPPRPATIWTEPQAWYHFDSTGALTGAVRIGREITPHQLRGNLLWAVVTDSITGLPTVVRYRIGD